MQDMTSSPTQSPAPSGIPAREWFDLGDMVRLYRRHLLLLSGIVISCVAAAVIAAFLLPQRYEAVSRVRVDPQRRAVLDTTVQSQNFQTDQARVDTEVQFMRSADISKEVTRRLGLWQDPRFIPEGIVGGTSASTPAQRDALIEQVARGVAKNFSVRRNGNSFILDLVYIAPDGQTAADIANGFAEAYVNLSGRTQSEQARNQSRYLERQMGRLGSQVRSSDAQIADYRSSTGITQSGSAGTVTDQQIGPVSSAYAVAQSEAAAANGKLGAAQGQVRGGSIFAVSDVLNSTVITQLRGQRAELLGQKADLDNRYGPNHPDTQRVSSQLAAVEGQIRDEAGRIVSRLAADAQAANSRAGALGGRLGGLKGEQASNTRAAVTADSLQRENDANRQIYNRLAEQAQQTGQQAQVLQPAGAIVQAALVPNLSAFPNKKVFVFAGLLAGLMLGSIVIFAIEFMRRGLRTTDEVARLGVEFLGSVPLLGRRERARLKGENRRLWDAVVAKPMSAFAESIRTLRANVLNGPLGAGGVAVTIISSLPAEGKSHTAVSLAQICAGSGDRTIIVDCDLRRPALAGLLETLPPVGLAEVLGAAAPWRDAVAKHPQTGLDVLPVLQPDFTERDLIGGEAFRALIAELRDQYDVVVLDTPPVLAVAAARVIAGLADRVIYLAKWEQTPRGAVKSGLALLRRDNIQPMGVLLNMIDTSQQSSISEDDPVYYQKAYAAYYQN